MQDKKSFLTTSLPTVTTSSEQDHDNAIFGSELVSLNTMKSPVVQEDTVAVSVKVCIYISSFSTHTCAC